MRGGLLKASPWRPMSRARCCRTLPLLTADYPALAMGNWFGLVAPAGLPAERGGELGRLFLAAMAEPATAALLASRGMAADFAGCGGLRRRRSARTGSAGRRWSRRAISGQTESQNRATVFSQGPSSISQKDIHAAPLSLGIDIGGTFTDLVDPRSERRAAR